jgi:hypothetical protein
MMSAPSDSAYRTKMADWQLSPTQIISIMSCGAYWGMTPLRCHKDEFIFFKVTVQGFFNGLGHGDNYQASILPNEVESPNEK